MGKAPPNNDAEDRRKVFVRVRPESLAPLIPRYEAMGKAYMALAKEYGDNELRLICEYLEKTSEVTERELANLITANRSRAGKSEV